MALKEGEVRKKGYLRHLWVGGKCKTVEERGQKFEFLGERKSSCCKPQRGEKKTKEGGTGGPYVLRVRGREVVRRAQRSTPSVMQKVKKT